MIRRFALATAALTSSLALAVLPPPANDSPAGAEVITTLPAVVVGRNVNADDTISTTTITGLTNVPGPDVFYRFTPDTTGVVWIMMIPWVEIPVYSSGGGTVPLPNLCVYVRRADTGEFIAGSDANGRDQVDSITPPLLAGVPYEIVVDSREVDPRGQSFDFTLVVARPALTAPDTCASAAPIAPPSFPTAVVGSLTGAVSNFSFPETSGRCDVVDASFLTVQGPDHVYTFTTGPNPSDAGDYMINLIPAGQAWNGFVYVSTACPPSFPATCLGAASHTNSTVRQSEAVVVTLAANTSYSIYVDAASLPLPNARYVLIVDRASGYEISEAEGNDTPLTASPLNPAAADGGQIVGAADRDLWAIGAVSGSRLYALVDVGNASLASIDSELSLLASDGSSVIEFDDDDGEGSLSPLANFIFRTSSFSSAIAGAVLGSGAHFLQVDSNGAATFARYALHVGVQPAGRLPAPECEPNNELGLADVSRKLWFAGAIEPAGDVDYYRVELSAGDTIFVALDGDPERDSGGADPNSIFALDGALEVLDPDGDVLIADHDDENLVGAGQTPDYPAEALAFVAPVTGAYGVGVRGGGAGDFGLGRTYHLAIFINDAAPALIEAKDPIITSITPNFGDDTLTIAATDNAPGDGGLCAASLAPGSINLEIASAVFNPGDPNIAVVVGLVNPAESGDGKIVITDCAGNTACAAISIDASLPQCSGVVTFSNYRRFESAHPPIHVPDNQPGGPGVLAELAVDEVGVIADVDATVTVESSRVPDVDVQLISPANTVVPLFLDRGGVGAFDVIDATFDDSASELMSILSSDEPYTGRWLPESPLSSLNGQQPAGVWRLQVIDDSNSSSGGSRLVRWSLDINGGFANPEFYAGQAADVGGLLSIGLADADNAVLELTSGFQIGDNSASYVVTLIDQSRGGGGTVVVTDLAANVCETPVTLRGLPDLAPPVVSGQTTRDVSFGAEVQQEVPGADPEGVLSSVLVPDSALVGQVIVRLTVNTLDVGRIAAKLTKDLTDAVLLNRVGMDERGSVGLTKDNFDLEFNDDLPASEDAHEEPALGTIEFIGPHQPDGRGEYFGDGVTGDARDNMLFVLDGLDAMGNWSLLVTDNRLQGAPQARSIFRRWSATVTAPGAAEHYDGVAVEAAPQAGVCSIELAPGALNLAVIANFGLNDRRVPFRVVLVDPAQPGQGTVVVSDCAGNATDVGVELQPELPDQSLPLISGAVNPGALAFEGVATDNGPGDSGIAAVELAPHAANLVLTATNPDPPNGAGQVSFVVDLIDNRANGRGYVRVTDQTGYRRHALIEIDAIGPMCTGSIGRTKRYISNHGPLPIPDNSPGGVISQIAVADAGVISDLDLTFNITHPFVDDIELTLVSPQFVPLLADIGLTGNDFIDTTLDDEAAQVIPDSSAAAPFTGAWRPLPPAVLSVFDNHPVAANYQLAAVDDAVFNLGTLDSWSLTITSPQFPLRYNGRATDDEPLGSGVCAVSLAPGAINLALAVDPFQPGSKIARYGVSLVNPQFGGVGAVRVEDCAGNVCESPIVIDGPLPICAGDMNCDGVVNFADIDRFVEALAFPGGVGWPYPCEWIRGDMNTDGQVNFADIDPFVAAIGAVCP